VKAEVQFEKNDDPFSLIFSGTISAFGYSFLRHPTRFSFECKKEILFCDQKIEEEELF